MTAARGFVTPLRFVGGVIGLWTVARLAVLMPYPAPLALDAPAKADPFDAPLATARPLARVAAVEETGIVERAGMPPAFVIGLHAGRQAFPIRFAMSSETVPPSLERSHESASRVPNDQAPANLSPSGLIALPAATASRASRWSGNLYMFRRGDGGTAALASGGQLGGSQAGARVAYRLDRAGHLAVAGRLSTPLDDMRGAEGAIGLDWHPLPAAPMRLSIERRVDLGGRGRDAWSAYAAGGFWRQSGRIVLDGYAQAGVVGARRHDLFADGALRAGYRAEIGGGRSLTLGAGAWAAAQPRVERVDVGPRAALGFSAGGMPLTLAAEWRVRVVGDAAPGSGLALTLAADF
jgi:hypothetical protein